MMAWLLQSVELGNICKVVLILLQVIALKFVDLALFHHQYLGKV